MLHACVNVHKCDTDHDASPESKPCYAIVIATYVDVHKCDTDASLSSTGDSLFPNQEPKSYFSPINFTWTAFRGKPPKYFRNVE